MLRLQFGPDGEPGSEQLMDRSGLSPAFPRDYLYEGSTSDSGSGWSDGGVAGSVDGGVS